MKAATLIAGGLIGAAALGGSVATAHAVPVYYGDQGDGNGLAYLTELRDAGLIGGMPVDAAVKGRQICWQRAQGATELDLAEAAEASGATMHQAAVIVVHAEYHFCPDAMYTWPGH